MTHICQRRDTLANWELYNPVLMEGELGWVVGTPDRAKMGDGVTPWTGLDYIVRGEVVSVNGHQGVVLLTKDDLNLDQVDNTSDQDKPVSDAQGLALSAKAPLENPVFTGDPQAPTPAVLDNSASIATTKFVKDQDYINAQNLMIALDSRDPSVSSMSATGNLTGNSTTGAWQPATSSTGGFLVFQAPDSGLVEVSIRAYLRPGTAGNGVLLDFEVRTGSVFGGGTQVRGAEINTSAANYNAQYIRTETRGVVDGLTPGATYHARQMYHQVAGGGALISNAYMQVLKL